jgi:hypothetical protein
MDPISIIATSATLVRLCATTSGYLFTFVTNVRKADTEFTTLGLEVNSLLQVLSFITECFSNSSLANAVLSCQTGHETQHWTNVERSMKDGKKTLESLVRILETVKKGSDSGAKSPISFGMSSAEITLLKEQIIAYRQTMQLSLQLITVYAASSIYSYHVCSSSILPGKEAITANQKSTFDGLKADVQRLTRFFRDHHQLHNNDPNNPKVIKNLQHCIQSAGELVSSALTMVSTGSPINGGSESGRASRNKGVPVVTGGPDPEITMHLIQQFKKQAKSKFDAGEYAEAEKCLRKAMNRSEAMQGERFEGRGEILQRLALALSGQGKWEDLYVLLKEKF